MDNIRKAVKPAILIILALVMIFVIGIWMANRIMNTVIHNRREIIVPEIEGLTINDALTLLSEKDLSLFKVAEKYDVNVPAGSIISQAPPPGLTVREGKAIEAVVVSSGGKVVFIPEVKGKSIRQAEILLRQTGLLIGEQLRTFSNEVQMDFVVSQDPAAGEVVEKNSYVNIIVSRGPAEEEKIKKMPNLLGRNINRVERVLRDLNLELSKIETVVNDELEEGTVIEQKPEQGVIVDENSKVELTVSKESRSFKEVREGIIYYEVVQSGQEKAVKIIIEDDIGERVVYEGKNSGGSKIEVPVKVLGIAQVKIYINEILVKEEELEYKPELEDKEEAAR
ncbi:MAG: PASTA domain-containing protein [Elusimicrobiota bacterium]